MTFKAERRYFTLDGKPYFLYSGEIHYFRVSRDLWPEHLAKLKAAGANTVSTYIPWSWHEIEPGVFDLTGQTDPQRDILGFLDAAAAAGLNISVKPGPYILAEFEDRGIPAWLLKKYPEIQGKGTDSITYLHPVFQDYVKKWYDAILPHLAKRQITRGGRIILMQVCNEVGLFQWLAGAGDTGKVSLKYFHYYLQKQYRTIEAVNRLYGTRYRSFAAVPAPSKPTRSPGDYVAWNDWHDFHRWYYAEYLSWLISEIRGRDIEIQLFHNIPGWVFGRGTEYPINISFYAEIVKRHPDMVFGVDHIPENPNYRNLHDDLLINEMTRALQGGQKPIWAAEQQAGTREHNVHTFPNELELFYQACLARGMTGMNLYMFSQGINPERRGAFGPTFYWMTALGHDAKEKSLYPVVQKLGRQIATFGASLAKSEKRASLAVGFYRPYYHDEFYYPLFGGVPKINAAQAGLRYEPKTMRNTYYFEGMLRVLVLQNRDFDMVDLQTMALDPKRYPHLWVLALDCMDRETQGRLAEYVAAGGHLLVWPGLPDKDLKMRPCAVLRQKLGLREGTIAKKAGLAKIDVLGIQDINAATPVRTFTAPAAQEIAHLDDGTCCGVLVKSGRGQAAVLGTIFTYNIKEHLWAFEKLYQLGPESHSVELDNPAVQAQVRFGEDYAFLFLLNYTPKQQKTGVRVRQVPKIGDWQGPQGGLVLGPLQALMIPIQVPLAGTPVRLASATCQIIEMQARPEGLEGWVEGSAFQETAVVLSQVPGPVKAFLDEVPVEVQTLENRVQICIPKQPGMRRLKVQW